MLKKEIDKLKTHLLSLSAVVAESVDKSMLAVDRRDVNLADEVIQADRKIDELEVELEEECLKVLALHQPVAKDLRVIVAFLKINNDLERIGDLTVNIAKRARFLADYRDIGILPMDGMVEKVRNMLRMSLDSVVNLDANEAKKVLQLDDEVDERNRKNFRAAQIEMREKPDATPGVIAALTVSRNLERIADLATNIAEDAIYLIDGEIVRHQHEPD